MAIPGERPVLLLNRVGRYVVRLIVGEGRPRSEWLEPSAEGVTGRLGTSCVGRKPRCRVCEPNSEPSPLWPRSPSPRAVAPTKGRRRPGDRELHLRGGQGHQRVDQEADRGLERAAPEREGISAGAARGSGRP